MHFAEQIARADLISTEALAPAAPGPSRVDVDNLSEEELDHLPFGAIQLDTSGLVLRYNSYESSLSRVHKANALGRHFFREVAPCTNVREFYGRFQQGVAEKHLYEKFRYHFAFKHNPMDVTITLFYSELTSSIWVFVRPV